MTNQLISAAPQLTFQHLMLQKLKKAVNVPEDLSQDKPCQASRIAATQHRSSDATKTFILLSDSSVFVVLFCFSQYIDWLTV